MTADVPMNEPAMHQSVHGLKKECLSYGEVFAQSVSVIAPTTVPAAVLSFAYGAAGTGTWLSFLLAMVGLLFVGINVNQFACRSASPGSLYSYIVKGLGPTAGILCALGLMLAYLFTGMSTLCGFAIFGQTMLGHLGIHTHILTLFALGVGLAWYVASKDIQLSAKMMLLLEGVSIALILLLGIIIWAHKGFAIDLSQLTLKGATPGGITMGIVLAVFGFSGFESATTLGDEAKQPLKTIPKAVKQSTIWAGLFFIVMTYIEVLGFSGTSADLAQTEAPLDFLAHQAGVDFIGFLISLGALASFFICTLGCINPAARVLFLLARHGLFHQSLGTTHAANLTPDTAIGFVSLLTFVVPVAVQLCGVSTFASQSYFGTICTLGFLLVYVLVSIAAPVYLYRLKQLRPLDVMFSLLAVSFMALPILGTVGISGSTLFPPPEAPVSTFPYLFGLYLAAGCGWFFYQRVRSPRMASRMQQAVEEIHVRYSDVNYSDRP
jgi:amino acid transporter